MARPQQRMANPKSRAEPSAVFQYLGFEQEFPGSPAQDMLARLEKSLSLETAATRAEEEGKPWPIGYSFALLVVGCGTFWIAAAALAAYFF